MQFLYNENAKDEVIELKGQEIKHLKARRKKSGDLLNLRNLKDEFIYTYKIDSFERNNATLMKVKKEASNTQTSDLTLAWAVVDAKVIEKTLPFLNEMGVKKIAFVYTEFSQKNFKLDFERMRRILINSCEQCGRSSLMELELHENLEDFTDSHEDFAVLDFGGGEFQKDIKTIFVGPEGGFSENERELFKNQKVFSLKTSLILRSESAAVASCAKILI